MELRTIDGPPPLSRLPIKPCVLWESLKNHPILTQARYTAPERHRAHRVPEGRTRHLTPRGSSTASARRPLADKSLVSGLEAPPAMTRSRPYPPRSPRQAPPPRSQRDDWDGVHRGREASWRDAGRPAGWLGTLGCRQIHSLQNARLQPVAQWAAVGRKRFSHWAVVDRTIPLHRKHCRGS